MDNMLDSSSDIFDLPLEKFRILFINVFTILYKAATLNPRKLRSDIITIHKLLKRSNNNYVIAHLYVLFISLVLFSKFFFGYVGLSANITAMLPILAEEGRELLTPSIIVQSVENIFFCMLDIIIGTITVRYFMPCKYPVFFIFLTKNVLQMSIGVIVLNIYRDFYQHLKYDFVGTNSTTRMKSDERLEKFVRKESLV